MKRRIVCLVASIILLFNTSNTRSQSKKVLRNPKNKKSFETHLLLEPRFYWFESQKAPSSGSEFYIRRAKFVFKGQASD